MIISYSPSFEGIDDEIVLQFLNSSVRFILRQKLNEPSTLTFEYPDNLSFQTLFLGESPSFPVSVTLNSKTVNSQEEDNPKDETLFFGFPNKIQRIAKSNTLVLTFVDPLVGSYQHSSPFNWAEKQKISSILKDVLKTFLKEGSPGLTLKAVIKSEDDFEVQTALSDIGMTKFQFLSQIVKKKYGLNFYYAHDLNPKGQIVFFKPVLKPSEYTTLPAVAVFGYATDFSVDFFSAYDQVDIQGQEQEHSADIKEVQEDFSESAKAILKCRESVGLKFEFQNIFPNEPIASCKDLAESQMIEGVLGTHTLSFESQDYFKVGSYIKIDSKDSPFASFLEGYYLITEVERRRTKTNWIHKYKGVRA
jgi:hypothetical protein